MEDLIDFVSTQTKLPVPQAKAAVSATLNYIQPNCSPLLKNSIEVMLKNPELSESHQDLLIATRILFPDQFDEHEPSSKLDD